MQVAVDHKGTILVGGDMEILKNPVKVFNVMSQVLFCLHKLQKEGESRIIKPKLVN